MVNIFDLLINNREIETNLDGYRYSYINGGCILYSREIGLRVILIIGSNDKRDLVCEYLVDKGIISKVSEEDVLEVLTYIKKLENSTYKDLNINEIKSILERNKKKIAIINKKMSIFIDNTRRKKKFNKCTMNLNGNKIDIDEFRYFISTKIEECSIKLIINNQIREKIIYIGDELVLSISDKDEREISTSIVCKEYKESNGVTELICSNTLVYDLAKVKTSYLYVEEPIKKVNDNILHFMLRQSGLKDENINCSLTEENNILAYKVILLVRNLQLNYETACSYVTFYSDEVNNYEINKFKEKLKETNYSYENCSFAEVIVNANSLYDAYLLAREIVLITTQVIRFTVRDNILNGSGIKYWNRYNENWELEISKWSYIECLPYNQVIIGNIDNIYLNNNMNLDGYEKNNIIKNSIFIDKLLNKNISDGLKNILRVIKWVNKSWNACEFEEKILYTVIAMEFLIVNEKDTPLIEKYQIRKIKEYIQEELKEEISNNILNKVNDKISNSLTSDTMMNKFNNLLEVLEIHLEQAEKNIIKDIRRIRNDITHGREYEEINVKDIDKVNSIIILISKKLLGVKY